MTGAFIWTVGGTLFLIVFETEDAGINPLMGWETNSNTLSELNLEFSSKELAIEYAKKNKIDFEIINI